MPEIIIPVIPGLRDVGNGASEAQHATLREMRENHQIYLWADRGTEESCEASWRAFLLADTPDWEIWS
jgi:hypothetical protein